MSRDPKFAVIGLALILIVGGAAGGGAQIAIMPLGDSITEAETGTRATGTGCGMVCSTRGTA